MENIDIAARLDEIADLLDIQGANPFRIRAYRNAARTVGTLGTPVASLIGGNGHHLQELPGIGADLADKIACLSRTGDLPLLHQLAKKTPASLVTLLRIPGIGPKRARLIHDTLRINTLAQLEKAARSGRIAQLKGMGTRVEHAILEGITHEQAHGGRRRLADAEAYVRPIVELLRTTPGVTQVDMAGSLRRRAETVGDADILVASETPDDVVARFVAYPGFTRTLARGGTKCSAVLRSGLQVDLRIVSPGSYGAALHYFTGSKAHNIAVRFMGVKKGLKINEYGVFRGRRSIAGATEEEVFGAVGLPWIPPELREDRGELDAAKAGRLPTLLTLADIRGDLQMNSAATDGVNTPREMIRACEALGYQYIAITDHSSAVRVAGGLTAAGFRRQWRAIERLQAHTSMVVFKGAEVDILEDGSLDLDDDTLAGCDVVIAAVHSHFGMSGAAMTRRIVRALRHPRVHILAHPTGRLIGTREPYAVDTAAVVEAARDCGVMLEVNAQPNRLDLSDVHIRIARDAGVPVVVSTDAHRVQELGFMRYGVDQARRAWCERDDVANTRTAAQFRKLLAR